MKKRPRETAPQKKNPTAHLGRPDCLNCATSSNCIVGKLEPTDLAAVSLLIHESEFRRGAEISSEGAIATNVKIIKIGTLFSYRTGKDGCRRPIGIAGRGAVFGLHGSFGRPNQLSGIAVSAGRYCELSIRHLQEDTTWGPAFREQLISDCVHSFGLTADWSAIMRLRTLVKQLAYALLLLSEVQGSAVVQLPTHTALAELLGTTRESIVRGLVLLENEGCIAKMERKKCHVFGNRLLEWMGDVQLA